MVNLQTLFPQYKEFAGMYILDIYQAQTCSEARSGERGGETAPFLVTDIFLNLQLSIEMNFERFFRIVFKIIKRSYHIHIFRYKNIYPRCRKKNRQNSYL